MKCGIALTFPANDNMTIPHKSPPVSHQDDEHTDYAGKEELWAGEKFLKNYNLDIVTKLSSDSRADNSVLEFGAGIGTLASIWHSTTGKRPECIEIDQDLRDTLSSRGFTTHKDIESVKNEFDIIYTSNVLEHIHDDTGVLKKLHTKIKPGGVIAIFVPAFSCLYSELDAAVGHYRRYEKDELRRKLELAGFTIEKIHYVDSIGFLAWFYTKLRGYGPKNKLGSGNDLHIYDTYLFPLRKFLDAIGFRFLLGKNLLAIARKPSTPSH